MCYHVEGKERSLVWFLYGVRGGEDREWDTRLSRIVLKVYTSHQGDRPFSWHVQLSEIVTCKQHQGECYF